MDEIISEIIELEDGSRRKRWRVSSSFFFDELYKNFNITRVPAKRMINSDPTKRGKINEIVVTNYSVA